MIEDLNFKLYFSSFKFYFILFLLCSISHHIVHLNFKIHSHMWLAGGYYMGHGNSRDIKPSPIITSNSLFQHVGMLSVEDYKASI